MPKDPAALLSLGHDKNGLNSSDVKPWHIRGNYTFYDSDGKVEDKGVYEEWWISEKQYKRSFSGTNFAQAEFATGDGLFRTCLLYTSLLDLDDVLQGAGDEEKLLFQTQLLALDLLVVGVENLGDIFGVDLVPDGGEEITGVEAFNVE